MDPKEVLAVNLQRLMEHHSVVSQSDLARRCKVDQTTISRILARKNAAQIDKIQAIARVFGLDAWQMLTPGFDPANPPVVQLTAIERELYERLRNAAEAFSIKK